MLAPTALVSAADSAYFPLLRGLLRSARSLPHGSVRVCVIDLGLGADERAWVDREAARVADGRWDFDFPGRVDAARALQGLSCRPFLPEYFPGHESYLWIDADAWIQEPATVERFRDAARDGALAVVAELDPAYATHFDGGAAKRWLHRQYRVAFGREAADLLFWYPLLNTGVFALRGDSDAWGAWAEPLGEALRRTTEVVDQTTLNALVHGERVRARLLPAEANWMCRFADPAVEAGSGRLVHPLFHERPLGIVHLSAPWVREGARRLATTDGGSVSRWLHDGASACNLFSPRS